MFRTGNWILRVVAKLGGNSAFLGKVGNDFFGEFLIEVLGDTGVDTSNIVQTSEAKTGLAFVALDADGDRDFIFYRDPSADMLYRKEELPENVLSESKILHFGSIGLINNPIRETTFFAIEIVKNNGGIISYDPNLRMPLWPNKLTAKKWIIEGLKRADIVKVSDDELIFITGKSNLEKGARDLVSLGAKLLFVTLGVRGCYVYYNNKGVTIPGFKVKTEDTTGAGDGFTSGILYQLINQKINLEDIKEKQLSEMVLFANAVGAITTTQKGAIKSLPDLTEVKSLLKGYYN